VNCYYHPQTTAVRQCERCSKGLCRDCDYDGLCYEDVGRAIMIDYSEAKRLRLKLWVFIALVTIFLLMINQAEGITAIVLVPLFALIAWCVFWGWRWYGRLIRGRSLIFAILFGLLMWWSIPLAGLVTGFGDYAFNRKTIKIVNGDWGSLFPGKWNPQTEDYFLTSVTTKTTTPRTSETATPPTTETATPRAGGGRVWRNGRWERIDE
jgi:hypothetical protein